MSAYIEAVMQTEAEIEAEVRRDEITREAVQAALAVIDEAYPEFKKSKGPFGDSLANSLHKQIEGAFAVLDEIEKWEREELKRLQNKYSGA